MKLKSRKRKYIIFFATIYFREAADALGLSHKSKPCSNQRSSVKVIYNATFVVIWLPVVQTRIDT